MSGLIGHSCIYASEDLSPFVHIGGCFPGGKSLHRKEILKRCTKEAVSLKIDKNLDQLSDLSVIWSQKRKLGAPASTIRSAMLNVVHEIQQLLNKKV